MTKTRWLECDDSWEMLEFLGETVSERKPRFFACACCRFIWRFLQDTRSRTAVEMGECYADGACTKKALNAARVGARVAWNEARTARGIASTKRPWDAYYEALA